MTICCLASAGVCGSELNGRISKENETGNADAATASRCPTVGRSMAGGGSENRIKDKATIMIAVENLVAYLLCQYSDPLIAAEHIDSFADNVREIVNSHYLEK